MNDVNNTLYDRIIKASNREYNLGLEKAKVRDLSGAANYLKRALRLNKHHTDARNLLGLIYYEMGDLVEALSQWVISKNLDPKNNRADYYLEEIQSNQGRMEAINQNIKKYNQALAYAGKGSEDLAIMQLKKVLAANQNFVKGYQLLGLLYIHKEEYDKAKKALYQVLRIDKSNTLAMKYMAEVKAGMKAGRRSKKTEQYNVPEEMSHEDVIIPPSYKENTGWQSILQIGFGLLVGAAVVYFLIMPARARVLNNQNNELVRTYNDKLAAKDNEISDLNNRISELEGEKGQIEQSLSSFTDENTGILSEYNNLLLALNHYLDENMVEAANQFVAIDPNLVADGNFQAVYATVKAALEEDAWEPVYQAGTQAFQAGNFEQAADYYHKCLTLRNDYVDAMYWLGYAYENLGNIENAVLYYQLTEDTGPRTAAGRDARTRREQLQAPAQ